jgi:hypothetical protein
MNLVLEDGEEVDTKNNTRVKIGKKDMYFLCKKIWLTIDFSIRSSYVEGR